MATRLWNFLTTDSKGLVAGDAAQVTVNGTPNVAAGPADRVLKLAAKLQQEGPQSPEIGPLVGQISSLFDTLRLPLGRFVAAKLPFEEMAADLIAFYRERTQREPTLDQAVVLIAQAAYLESINVALASPKLRDWLRRVSQEPPAPAVIAAIEALADLTIDDRQIRLSIIDFPASEIAIAFNGVWLTCLGHLGLPAATAQIITQRVAQLTEQRMRTPLISVGERVQRLVEWYRIGGRSALDTFLSLDSYLDRQIKPRPETLVLDSFRMRDLYVPPQAQILRSDGQAEPQGPVDLQGWLTHWLDDDHQPELLLLQGESGRGKSQFCAMFADWVRMDCHPTWTPIVISLDQLGRLEPIADFALFLQGAIDQDFVQDDPQWLTAPNVRFLFIVDGLDSLNPSSLEAFLLAAAAFVQPDRDCSLIELGQPLLESADRFDCPSDCPHRMIVTGRLPEAIEQQIRLPTNLRRLELLPLRGALQDRWLTQWAKLIGRDATPLRSILQNPRLPESIRLLGQEPLFLPMLAAMYRNGSFGLEPYDRLGDGAAKVELYMGLLNWVLQQGNLGDRRSAIASLRELLAEAGLCAVQLGQEYTPLGLVADRLPADSPARTLLEDLRLGLRHQPTPLILATVRRRSPEDREGAIVFAHRSFSEFLFAERLKGILDRWLDAIDQRLQTTDTDWLLYDALGYGSLTADMVQYLMVLLNASSTFEPIGLFRHLEDFYGRWSSGILLDGEAPTLAQQKRQALADQRDRTHLPGQRQIDGYVGLNVLILLLELNRYARARDGLKQRIVFYPNGRPNFGSPTTDHRRVPDRLLHSLQRWNSLGLEPARQILGPFLSNANLSGSSLRGIDLRGANLSGADLSGTDLSGANLCDVDLRGADLSGANLSGALLRRANLRRTSLSRACLIGANLQDAALSNSDLIGASLNGANLCRADLGLADLSLADLRSASLDGADLSLADLRSANLGGAILDGAILNRAAFGGAHLGGSSLHQADLSLADLSGADLSLADLSGANLSLADLSRANLSLADLQDTDLSGADLDRANLQGIQCSDRTLWDGVRNRETALVSASEPESIALPPSTQLLLPPVRISSDEIDPYEAVDRLLNSSLN
jgi:uncharacterized protein YjbI with pentapeptide repeats